MTKTAAVVIDSGPQNTVRFGAGQLRFGSQVVARRIDVFGPFRAVMAGRIGTWVARIVTLGLTRLKLSNIYNPTCIFRPAPQFLPLGRAENSQASGLYVLEQYYL